MNDAMALTESKVSLEGSVCKKVLDRLDALELSVYSLDKWAQKTNQTVMEMESTVADLVAALSPARAPSSASLSDTVVPVLPPPGWILDRLTELRIHLGTLRSPPPALPWASDVETTPELVPKRARHS